MLDRFLNEKIIFRLNECLEFPENIVWSQVSRCDSVEVLCIVLDKHSHSCSFIEHKFSAVSFLADAVAQNCATFNNRFGFVHSTLLLICRSKLNGRQVYNGHKVHGITFQSIVLQNVLIGNLVESRKVRRHDYTMLYEPGILDDPQRVA